MAMMEWECGRTPISKIDKPTRQKQALPAYDADGMSLLQNVSRYVETGKSVVFPLAKGLKCGP